MVRGRIVCFEGIDGSGKSSLIQRVSEELVARGCIVYIPNKYSCQELGVLIEKEFKKEEPDLSLLALLFAADRKFSMKFLKDKMIQDETVVIYDRYYFSSIVYQGYLSCYLGQDVSPLWVELLNRYCVHPDKIVYVDVSVEEAHKRILSRGGYDNIFESYTFLSNAKKAYEIELKRYGGSVFTVDSEKDFEQNVCSVLNFILS
ncbi:MAG: dTMP kinase [Patescibacteria group bacterium]|nr:dTMP kinase [Patescibacteria group bacterium]